MQTPRSWARPTVNRLLPNPGPAPFRPCPTNRRAKRGVALIEKWREHRKISERVPIESRLVDALEEALLGRALGPARVGREYEHLLKLRAQCTGVAQRSWPEKPCVARGCSARSRNEISGKQRTNGRVQQHGQARSWKGTNGKRSPWSRRWVKAPCAQGGWRAMRRFRGRPKCSALTDATGRAFVEGQLITWYAAFRQVGGNRT